jgi:hypothetical protein
MSASRVTSQTIGIAPHSAASARSGPSCRSAAITAFAPSATNRRASARPIPLAARRDDKQAFERIGRGAVRPLRIGGGDPPGEFHLERAPLGLVERRQQRAETAALDEIEYRVLAREDLGVLRVPDIQRVGVRAQQVVIERRVADRPVAEDGLQTVAPGAVAGGVHHQAMRRRVVVGRYLDRQAAARRDEPGKPRKQRVVAVEPLQRRVRVQDVDFFLGLPVGYVGFDPCVRIRLGPGAGQHLRRVVDADDPRVGPPPPQQRGDVAGAAAEVDDALRRRQRNAGKQFRRRPEPVVLEGEILVRVPAHRTSGAHVFRLRSHRSNSLAQASSDAIGA